MIRERKTVSILGVPIDNITMEETIEKLSVALNEDHCHAVYTPNAEFMMESWRNKEFRGILSRADMCVPDGAGVVLASRILKTPLSTNVPGIDLSSGLMAKDHGRKLKVYLFGSKPGVAEEAAQNLENIYPGIEICGTRNGYFTRDEEPEIVSSIAAASPDLLLVALGRMKQESFIERYKNQLNARVCIGVGGSLDVFAGRVSLAPEIFRKNGFEWLYRLCKEPKRFFRMLDLPKFILVVVGVRLGVLKNKNSNM